MLTSNQPIMVKLVPSSKWLVAEDLKSAWGNIEAIHLGNSSYQFHWASPGEPGAYIGVPGIRSFPDYMHALTKGKVIHLGPVVAVLVADYLGGDKPFTVQTLFLRELVVKARNRGVLVYIITPESVLARNYLQGYTLVENEWVKETLPYPDIVYNRYFGSDFSHRDEIIKELTNRGAKLVNAALPNKWDCYLWLKTDPLLAPHLPETRLYKSIKDIYAMLAKYPEVYLKPRAGYRGQGIARLSKSGPGYLLVTAKGQTIKMATLDRLPSYIKSNAYIVQQGIRLWNHPRFYDLKVLVQNTGPHFVVTGKVARQAEMGKVTTHLHQGGEALLLTDYIKKLPPDWQSQVEASVDRIALQTAKVLTNKLGRLGEFSMDMGLDKNGKLWIIEVNGKPSRKSFRVAGDLAARDQGYEHLIDYFIYDFLHDSR